MIDRPSTVFVRKFQSDDRNCLVPNACEINPPKLVEQRFWRPSKLDDEFSYVDWGEDTGVHAQGIPKSKGENWV